MHSFGDPDVLGYEDVPTPIPGPTDVLVRVAAVSVNRTLDVGIRAGTYNIKPPLPHVLGCDPTGTVAQVGSDARGVAEGQRVMFKGSVPCRACPDCLAGRPADCKRPRQLGLTCWGGYAEYICVPAANLRVFPDSLSFAEASMIFRHFPQAFRLLEDTAGLQSGEWL